MDYFLYQPLKKKIRIGSAVFNFGHMAFENTEYFGIPCGGSFRFQFQWNCEKKIRVRKDEMLEGELSDFFEIAQFLSRFAL